MAGRRKTGAQSFGPRRFALRSKASGGPSCRNGQGSSAFFVIPESQMTPMNERGNVFIEYFVLALTLLLAVIAFYSGGTFMGTRAEVENTFFTLCREVAGADCVRQ